MSPRELARYSKDCARFCWIDRQSCRPRCDSEPVPSIRGKLRPAQLLSNLLVTESEVALSCRKNPRDASRFAGDLLIRRPQLLKTSPGTEPLMNRVRGENLGRLDSLGGSATISIRYALIVSGNSCASSFRCTGTRPTRGTFVELSDVGKPV